MIEVRILQVLSLAAVAGQVDHQTVPRLQRLADFVEPAIEILRRRPAPDARHLVRAEAGFQIVFFAEQLREQAVDPRRRLRGIDKLQVALRRIPVTEVDVVRRAGQVELAEQRLKKEDVLFERDLVAVGRVTAADRQKVVGRQTGARAATDANSAKKQRQSTTFVT